MSVQVVGSAQRSPPEASASTYSPGYSPEAVAGVLMRRRISTAAMAARSGNRRIMDWLVEALAGKFGSGYDRKMFLRSGGGGPNGNQGEGQDALHWWAD